ncbi:MAG: segregation/condensation protein A, partial [Erysipelotrichaceae bacterium]|nr:segregation/condensation protein A [Erysipelotrichaceae bacterium]
VDIYDIPIAMITEQYLTAMHEMEEDLETLSDFLVLAAELLDIKARMLLPKDETEEEDETDPRSELVQRLIEYQEYRMMAGLLREVYDEDEEAVFREPSVPEEVKSYRPAPDYDVLLAGVTPDRLKEVFLMVLSRKEELRDPIRSEFGDIERETVRISDKLTMLLDRGKELKHFSFRALLEEQHTRADVVVTFLACLELIRIGQIQVSQKEIFADIELSWNDDCDAKLSKEEIEEYD